LSRKNPDSVPKKSRVKTVFPASSAAATAAGYAAASITADAIRDPCKIFPGSEDEGMALTWVIKSLTEPTEYAEKNQKNLSDLCGLCERKSKYI
jgi:hypothetical protein